MRGDLQEGHVYAKRLRDYASRCQFPHFPSTIMGFLCAFGLRNPCFRAFRAQNRGFCALLAAKTLFFRSPEHKIRVFVRFLASEPLFSGFSSTKSRFLCAFALRNPRFRASRAQNRGFCARLLNWISGLGHFPSDRGIVAPAQPILPLTLPPLHLRSRFSCGAVVSAQPLCHLPTACSRLAPVPPVPPVLPSPVAAYRRYRRCCRCYRRCTCGAASPAEPLHLRSRYYRSLPPSHLTARAG